MINDGNEGWNHGWAFDDHGGVAFILTNNLAPKPWNSHAFLPDLLNETLILVECIGSFFFFEGSVMGLI